MRISPLELLRNKNKKTKIKRIKQLTQKNFSINFRIFRLLVESRYDEFSCTCQSNVTSFLLSNENYNDGKKKKMCWAILPLSLDFLFLWNSLNRHIFRVLSTTTKSKGIVIASSGFVRFQILRSIFVRPRCVNSYRCVDGCNIARRRPGEPRPL